MAGRCLQILLAVVRRLFELKFGQYFLKSNLIEDFLEINKPLFRQKGIVNIRDCFLLSVFGLSDLSFYRQHVLGISIGQSLKFFCVFRSQLLWQTQNHILELFQVIKRVNMYWYVGGVCQIVLNLSLQHHFDLSYFLLYVIVQLIVLFLVNNDGIFLHYANVRKNILSQVKEIDQIELFIKRLVIQQRRNLTMLPEIQIYAQSSKQPSQKDKSYIDYCQFRDYVTNTQTLDVSTTTVNDLQRNSSRLDSLLYSSFVQIDRFVERQDLTFNLQSAESFFKRSSNLFFSDINRRKSQKMSHKKVQCQIGKGLSLASDEANMALLNKCKTLQVLKMVKLIKLIFKQLRSSITTLKQEVYININQIRKEVIQAGDTFFDKISIISKTLEEKCSRINQLQRENNLLNEQNDRLKQELDMRIAQNMGLLKQISKDAEKNAFFINKLEDQKEQNIRECNQKIYFFQLAQTMLTQEINSLNDVISDNQAYFKRLQYQKKVLQDQNFDLSKKNEELLKKQEENEYNFGQECTDNQRNSEEVHQLMKLNQQYLKELQICKEQIQKLKDENREIKRQSELQVAEQLQNLGEYFEEKYAQLISYCNKNTNQIHDFTQIFNTQLSENQSQENHKENKEKRKISVLSFRSNVSSSKKTHQIHQLGSLTNNPVASKQNKNNLNSNHKRMPKHSSQQIKQSFMLQYKQKRFFSIIRSSQDCLQGQEDLIFFKTKENSNGKFKPANFLLKDNEFSKNQSLNTTANSKNKQDLKVNDCQASDL